MLTNWKTSAAGGAAILTSLGSLLNMAVTGHVDPIQAWAALQAVIAGVGLLVARDAAPSK